MVKVSCRLGGQGVSLSVAEGKVRRQVQRRQREGGLLQVIWALLIVGLDPEKIRGRLLKEIEFWA